MNIEIANRLVSLRKSSHLSQEALAEKLGISRQAVSKWERAEASPDMDNLIQLARLYHISLDELLEIHEKDQSVWDPDTEVLQSEKMDGETKQDEDADKEPEEEEEYVDIGLGGVHVKDRDGSEVHIGWEGIHVNDEQRGEDVHIDKNGIYVNGEKYERKKIFNEHFPFAAVISISYILIGFLFHVWHPTWLLFLLIPLWYSFTYPVLVTFLFLCAGFFLNAWHPAWVLYLTIPIYYSFRRRRD